MNILQELYLFMEIFSSWNFNVSQVSFEAMVCISSLVRFSNRELDSHVARAVASLPGIPIALRVLRNFVASLTKIRLGFLTNNEISSRLCCMHMQVKMIHCSLETPCHRGSQTIEYSHLESLQSDCLQLFCSRRWSKK